MIDAAPFFADLAEGPAGARTVWLHAQDGVQLRATFWPGGDKGTVLLFPGRTEYIEKYGRTAADLARRDYCTVTLDWRGQGLADRPLTDPMVGHVASFADYQMDVAALLAWVATLDLPGPYFLISHSMGGCIGLRALTGGLRVNAAAFSAPMWGIRFVTGLKPVASLLSHAARIIGQDHRYAPGTGPATYLSTTAYDGNLLTTDRAMFDWMKAQITAQPQLALGGPSLHWLGQALAECRVLDALPSPDVPAFCAFGTAEKIIDTAAVERRMARWPKGQLAVLPGAEHEVMMETAATRTLFLDQATALFDAHHTSPQQVSPL